MGSLLIYRTPLSVLCSWLSDTAGSAIMSILLGVIKTVNFRAMSLSMIAAGTKLLSLT